jgi:hypothetical protein
MTSIAARCASCYARTAADTFLHHLAYDLSLCLRGSFLLVLVLSRELLSIAPLLHCTVLSLTNCTPSFALTSGQTLYRADQLLAAVGENIIPPQPAQHTPSVAAEQPLEAVVGEQAA